MNNLLIFIFIASTTSFVFFVQECFRIIWLERRLATLRLTDHDTLSKINTDRMFRSYCCWNFDKMVSKQLGRYK